MYQSTLERQWDNLVTDFITENQNLPDQTKTLATFAEWYRTSIFRFSSISAVEGMMLDQMNSPEFAQALRNQINSFSFKKVNPAPAPSAIKLIPAAAIAGIAVPLLLPLAPFIWTKFLWVRILSSIIAIIAAVALQLKKMMADKERDSERVFQEYVRQLRAYLPVLIDVCKRYNVA